MKIRLSKVFSLVTILAVMIMALPMPSAEAVSNTIVISQVYGGGGNSGATYKNDFIELYNAGALAVDITGWSVQYASAGGTSWSNKTALSGIVEPGEYYLVQESAGSGGTTYLPAPDAIGTIAMSATDGKVALVSNSTSLSGTGCPFAASVVDFVGYGTANCSEGTSAPALSNTTADIRNGNVDTDNNSADFTAGTPNPHSSGRKLYGVGAATPDTVLAGIDTLLTVVAFPASVPPSTGMKVSCNLSAISGSATQNFFDDGTNGDATAGDNLFSYLTTLPGNITTGTKTLPCLITDDQGRTFSVSISLTVTLLKSIGSVNGPVGDTEDATKHRSSFAPTNGNSAGTTTVVVQGVIYEKTLQAISGTTATYKGFFLQNTTGTADGNANTSDGLFVYMNTADTLASASGDYTPQVGDEVIVSGRISEYYNMTELQAPSLALLKVVRSGVDIDAEVAPDPANPPTALADANRYWERRQGMRVQVPQDSLVLGGRNVFNPADAEIWLARSDNTIALRTNEYERRAFRDAHPLDDNYDPDNWDGNGYRILIGSLGIKSTVGDAQALIDPARTFDTLTNSPAGGLNYTFSKYRIEITEQPTFSEGVDPSQNNPPTVIDRSTEYSIVDYNVENLYDYRDNPFSGCDFEGDTGCPKVAPFLAAVNPPYDYVPASDAAYQARLTDIAKQIINDLHSPDVLMMQEVENQDICKMESGALVCGTTNNADSQPDDLQDLAVKIASLGGPVYAAAFDRDSSDLRGIAPAFMYRTDRVQLLSPVGDPVLGTNPVIGSYTPVLYDSDVSNPKTLNAVYSGTGACETNWVFPRAPDIGLFRIWRAGIATSVFSDVYVIDNHFKSGPDSCVAHRTEQAKYNAALVAYIQQAKPNARIVVGGDLNVYPRPDDPFAPLTNPSSSDQLGALYNEDLGLKNLWEVLLAQAPEAAYSYVYQGQAQTLDQMFVNQTLLADLQEVHSAHINSDFPADYPGDVARGTSDHDPQVATYVVPQMTLDDLISLVQEYADEGLITGNNTEKALLDRLNKAAQYKAQGKLDAYRSQLQNFISQVQDKTPEFITQDASNALVGVAEELLSLP